MLIFLLSSCENALEVIDPNRSKLIFARTGISDEEATQLKKEFSIALAKALKESPAFRSLIKNKALEMVDEDYDILYHMIKN